MVYLQMIVSLTVPSSLVGVVMSAYHTCILLTEYLDKLSRLIVIVRCKSWKKVP